MDSSRIENIEKLLNSEFGFAISQFILGIGLNYLPLMEGDTRKSKLSEELQIFGMAVAGNLMFETVAQNIIPLINSTFKSLPTPSNIRVKIPEVSIQESLYDESSEKETRSLKG